MLSLALLPVPQMGAADSETLVIVSFDPAIPLDIEEILHQEGAVLVKQEPRIAFIVAKSSRPSEFIANMAVRADVVGAYVPEPAMLAVNELFCGWNTPTGGTSCVVVCSTSPTHMLNEPNDPNYHSKCGAQQWEAQWGVRLVNASGAWSSTKGSDAITVAVVDSGIDGEHPDLVGSYATVNGRYGFNTYDGSQSALDDTGHGTFVAGIIAARIHNGVGMSGMAEVRLLPIKACGPGGCPADQLAIGIVEAAASGARIISFSGTAPPPSRYAIIPQAEVIYRAFEYAHARGALIVVAAGNSGKADLAYPASHPRAFSVTSVGQDSKRAAYANYGEGLEMAAPGGSSRGEGIASTLLGSAYGFGEGTSAAAPFVSGAAGLVFSKNPTWNGTQVATCLMLAATPARQSPDQPIPNNDYGYGILDAGRAVVECAVDDEGNVVRRDPLTGNILDTRDLSLRPTDTFS